MDRPSTSYAFGTFVLDAAAYQLLAEGQPIDLSPKALDLLFLFAARPGLLLTKDDILNALWAEVAVTDNALTQVVSELRQALGDTPAHPRYVQTVPRRGYRFVGAVSPHVPSSRRVSSMPAPERTIAVGEFANLSQDAEVAWLSAGLAETVSNGLRVSRDLRLVDRAASGSPSTAAGIAVQGAFQRMGDQIRSTVEVVDTATGRAFRHAKVDGAVGDLFAVQDALV